VTEKRWQVFPNRPPESDIEPELPLRPGLAPFVVMDEIENGLYVPVASVWDDDAEVNAHLIADAPRMLKLLRHLQEILAHNPNLDTQEQVDGENSAAIYIARLRLSEFLAEPAGGAE
jgi:hypothetical protein